MGQSAVEVFELQGAMPNGGELVEKKKMMTHQTSQNPPSLPLPGLLEMECCFFPPPVSGVHLLDKLQGQGLG